MTLENVKEFLKDYNDCVIATIGTGNQPEAATVGFSWDDENTILIATQSSTRKAQNIAQNNKVAIVVGFHGDKTLQVEGEAEEVSRSTHSNRIEYHLETVPGARKYEDDKGQTYFLITPTWLRFTDYTQDDPIFETKELT